MPGHVKAGGSKEPDPGNYFKLKLKGDTANFAYIAFLVLVG